MDIKMIAVDLDGTLFNSDCTISDANIQAIKAVVEKGIKVVFCSGRTYKEVRRVNAMTSNNDFFISYHGAIIANGKGDIFIRETYFDTYSYKKIVDILEKSDIYFCSYSKDGILIEKRWAEVQDCTRYNNKVGNKDDELIVSIVEKDLATFAKVNTSGIFRIGIVEKDRNKIDNIMNDIIGNKYADVALMSGSYTEIVPKDVSKGTAIKLLSEYYRCKRNEIMTIGDSDNDISMLEYGGFGIAMANACEKVKQVADFITKSNDEDGVAYALKKFLL